MNNTIHTYYFKQEEKLQEEIFQQFLLELPVSFQDEIRKYKFRQSAESVRETTRNVNRFAVIVREFD